MERLLFVQVSEEMSSEQLREALGLKDRKSFHTNYIDPALDEGFIERTISGKPTSHLQKYRLTDKGKHFLQTLEGGSQA